MRTRSFGARDPTGAAAFLVTSALKPNQTKPNQAKPGQTRQLAQLIRAKSLIGLGAATCKTDSLAVALYRRGCPLASTWTETKSETKPENQFSVWPSLEHTSNRIRQDNCRDSSILHSILSALSPRQNGKSTPREEQGRQGRAADELDRQEAGLVGQNDREELEERKSREYEQWTGKRGGTNRLSGGYPGAITAFSAGLAGWRFCAYSPNPTQKKVESGKRKVHLRWTRLTERKTKNSTVLLAVNLLLTLTTLLWDPEFDDTLRNWGAPGTGTDGLAWYPTDFTRDIQPIACHSHNDYWRRVPLFSALRNGCTSVEADVWLFDDAAPELYVGHNRASLTRNRTFASLYIDPLVKILEGQNAGTDFSSNNNDNGTRRNGVFDVDPAQTLTLLIDVKTAGPETWPAVLAQLQPLRDRGWLSFVSDGELHTRPVTVVGTGNTPFDLLTRNSTYRDAFFDAPLDTMWETPFSPSPSPSPPSPPHDNPPCAATPPSHPSSFSSSSSSPQDQGHTGTTPSSSFTPLNSYYASAPFSRAVGRTWRGRLTPKQIATIRGQVRGAHRRGLKVRYWDTPSWPMGLRNHVWDVLVREGVDVLNVDDLRGVSRGVW
ncbi:hypothetical protein MBM_06347 [Drepanopeziza brunnea f. sp. 'multigermtubi' MB_m1]|uniref:Altered inheritance of mitochondria protein 6 n=1 Tax=Marssonina brunnea f. sp. multigermtubi (strain MB_m1) TaxID=1072389 RepID=K1XTA2_MARBU|nr:uncharacterized protein MBM_06347 [Drepanopeziza brunnea f. sp. 'multigermtubi' MB_m1]EKD15719.1 hypothetical protein MBM_06347 [Drepanopeziza brunnea f. sp. 'multigermtubi' MB_m1]